MKKTILRQLKEYLAFSKEYAKKEEAKNNELGYRNFVYFWAGQRLLIDDIEKYLKEMESEE